MKIVLANYRYYQSGGPETYLFNIAELLEQAGHTVIPYSVRSSHNERTPYEGYFPHGKSEAGDANFDSVKKSPRNIALLVSCAFYNREAYRNLRRLIRDERPDVIYVLQQVNALSPSIFEAAHDEGVRVVHRLSDFNLMCPRFDFLKNGEVCTSCIKGDFTEACTNRCFHSSFVATEIRVASMKYCRKRGLLGYVDAFVCPSAFTASLLGRSGVSSDRIHVVPTFVPPAPPLGEETTDAGSYVLYLGRISPEKGIDQLISAMFFSSNVHLKVAGSLNSEYAQNIVKKAEAAKNIEFLGVVRGEKKQRLIEGAACLVCPSIWYENLPNTVLEAYAYGKPVVVFDIGCMPEIVEDGVTGTVVPFGDVVALGDALKRYASDLNYTRCIGENCRRVAGERYSAEAHLSKLLDILSPSRS